eukprot:3631937-Heterocapsa_arctica.AAC.1
MAAPSVLPNLPDATRSMRLVSRNSLQSGCGSREDHLALKFFSVDDQLEFVALVKLHMNDLNELMSKWLNMDKGVVASKDL